MSESMLDHLFAAVDGLTAAVGAMRRTQALFERGNEPAEMVRTQAIFDNAMAGARLHLRAARDAAEEQNRAAPRDDEPWRTPGYRGDDELVQLLNPVSNEWNAVSKRTGRIVAKSFARFPDIPDA